MKIPRLRAVRWEWLVFGHAWEFGAGLFAAALLLVVWLILQTFFFAPAPVVSQAGERTLSVGLIDKLELWIEEVDAERKRGLALPARPLFVVDDPGPKED